MIAYIKEVAVLDDDHEEIGVFRHSVDSIYYWIPKDGAGAFSEEYKFLSDVLDSEFLNLQYEDGKITDLNKVLDIEIKDK